MTRKAFLPVILALPLAAIIVFSGCDSADDYAIDVTPAYTDVNSINQNVVLTAKGWSDYTWSLADPSIGYLTSTHGESVIYIAKSLPALTTSTSSSSTNTTPSSMIQVITVKARNAVVSSGSNATSSVSSVYKGEARIRHLSK